MRLNFAVLFDPQKNNGGHNEILGTEGLYAEQNRPPFSESAGDTRGQRTALVLGEQVAPLALPPMSPNRLHAGGQRWPCIHRVVPVVPNVPGNVCVSEIDGEAFEERAAIMEYDGGLSRAEAERLAADTLGMQLNGTELV